MGEVCNFSASMLGCSSILLVVFETVRLGQPLCQPCIRAESTWSHGTAHEVSWIESVLQFPQAQEPIPITHHGTN